MAKRSTIRGVDTVSLATPGDGVPGTSFSSYDVRANTLTISGGQNEETTIGAESDPNYLVVNTGKTPVVIEGALLGVDPADYPTFFGGTYVEGSTTYTGEAAPVDIFLTLRIVTLANDGRTLTITYPYVKMSARPEGTFTSGDVVPILFTATAQVPVSAAGTEGDLYTIAQTDAS